MTFSDNIKEDKLNIILSAVCALGFIFAFAGLSSIPVGNVDHNLANGSSIQLKVPAEDTHFQWVTIVWSLLGAALVLIGSGMRRRDILLSAMAFNTMVATVVTIAAHLMTELTYNCRNCADNFPGDCPSFTDRCSNGYNLYMLGSIILNLCQYVFLASCALRRTKIRESVRGNR